MNDGLEGFRWFRRKVCSRDSGKRGCSSLLLVPVITGCDVWSRCSHLGTTWPTSFRLRMGIRGKGACVFGDDDMEMFNQPMLVSALSLDFSLREVIDLLIL